MIKYKMVSAANGKTMYFKNGKMISKKTLSPSLLASLQDGGEITVPTPEPTIPTQTIDGVAGGTAQLPQSQPLCIFCNEPATRTTYVNLQTAHLCQEDKVSHTLGEVAEQLNKLKKD